MTITDVKIRRLCNENNLRALVSITFDDELAVHDLKVIEGQERLFVAMPSRKFPGGIFRDTVHPTNNETRQRIETAVLAAYRETLEKVTLEKEGQNVGEVQ